MINPRVYRIAFVPALLAVIVALFSLEPLPPPIEESPATSTFDARGVAATTRALVELAPDRSPGSSGDAAVADFVEERFRGQRTGSVAEQHFEANIGGEQVELRNVILTLPGESERGLLILAHRDSINEEGAASSAAATAILLELVDQFGGSRHVQNLIFASTDGGTLGGIGAQELLKALPNVEAIDAALVILQPGALKERPPFLITSSNGAQSASAQLVETAAAILREQTDRSPGLAGPLGDLARLAFPGGLGEQAVLTERGVPAIALSSAGEAPLSAGEDALDKLSSASLARVGRAALSTTLAIDQLSEALERGPGAYLRSGRNLAPGWALVALGLMLLLPALLTAGDATLRAARRRQRLPTAISWAIFRAVPFLAPVLLIYGLGRIGVFPQPAFPFDPRNFSLDFSEAVALVGLFVVFGLFALAIRPLRAPGRPGPQVLAAAAGLLATLAVLGIWLQNPYLGLILAPTAHVWLLGARERGPLPTPLTLVAVVASALPVGLAAIYVADQIELGLVAPWKLVVLMTSGQIPLGISSLLCVLAGSLIGSIAVARLARRQDRSPEPVEVTMRGPMTYAGPGSLGGTDSAMPRHG